MAQKSDFTVMLFYSNINRQSIKTRITINEFMEKYKCQHKVSFKEVDYEHEKDLSQKYKVMGTPTVLFLKNGNLLQRHFGEITSGEFKSIIDGVTAELV
jgi:thioredoxin-related protein